MKELECLKSMYLDEIRKITKKGELTPADSEAAKKALEAIVMIHDICEKEDLDEYSERSYNYSMPNLHSNRRGRNSLGQYTSRSNGDTVHHMIRKLDDMKLDAPDDSTRMAIDSVIERLEAY